MVFSYLVSESAADVSELLDKAKAARCKGIYQVTALEEVSYASDKTNSNNRFHERNK